MRVLAIVGNFFRAKKRPTSCHRSPGAQTRRVRRFKVDLHNHCLGDPMDRLTHSIYDHLDAARRAGIDALAMTWHRKVCHDEKASAYARERGMLLISGMEAEVHGKHLVILGLREGDLPGQPTWDEVRALRARRPGVVVMAPHPFYPHPTCLNHELNGNEDSVDAVEWCALHVHWLPSRVNPNLRAARWAQRHGKALVACSDAHAVAAVGRNPSMVEAGELTEEAILAAVRAGRVSFPRHSLGLGPLLQNMTAVVTSQPRHATRWMLRRLRRRSVAPQ
jgi:predicted metal-dependent phosphoesterase TrpH